MTSVGTVTIKTIATVLNLSLTTVSRVLNGSSEKHRISQKTQEIVIQKAKELGYIPNMAAKTLRNSQSKSIGLLLPSLDNPFFSQIASTVTKALYAKGYVVLISDCNNNVEEELKNLNSLIGQNLEGLLIIPSGDNSNFNLLSRLNFPILFIDREIIGLDHSYVGTDHYNSIYKLINYLYKRGHRRIACIQGDSKVSSNSLRVKGYNDFVSYHNLSFSYLDGDNFTAENGYKCAKKMIESGLQPSAIIAFSDTILLGVLRALKEHNWKIPLDVSVVSIDNSPYLDFLEVPITSISQPILAIAEKSSEVILNMISSENFISGSASILLDSIIVERNSVNIINK